MSALHRSAKFLIPVGILTASLMFSFHATPAQASKSTPTPTPSAGDISGGSGASGDATATPGDRLTLDLSSVDPQDVLAQLRSMSLIPQGGDLLQVRSLYVSARTKGAKYLTIFPDSAPADLVLQFTLEMNMEKDSADGSGCGFFFRDAGTKGYGGVLLTVDRHLQLFQYKGKKSLVNFDDVIDNMDGIDASNYDVDPGTIHTITIVAVGTNLTFFLDGTEITSSSDAQSSAGTIAMLLYNGAQTQQQNTCSYKYIWFLDLTNA